MAQLISVKLSRFDGSPWGFRLQGGKDFGTPLIVQKVNGGSPAEAAGLRAGDAVVRVNSTEMYNLRHKDAQDVIMRAGNTFEITVQRGGSTWKPSVTPVPSNLPSPVSNMSGNVTPVTKTSLAAKKQDGALIGSGHNFSPKPFLNGSSDGGPIKSIVNKQYNSPVGIYSEETIAETLSAQAEVLAGGVLGVNFKKNEKNYNAENSEVFKMVQEADKEPKTPEPVEPSAQSGVITPSSPALSGLRPVSAPETRPQQPTTPQSSLPPGQNVCAECERLIVGVFVRIKDKNLHVECFKCSTCGTSLKNVGYYNINNKLYCDIHAKLVARQAVPTGGLMPISVAPGTKAPASTISAALANAPMSPPLANHGSSPLPFSACNRTSHDRDDHHGSTYHPTRSSSNRNGCVRNGECNGYESKTFTSTITIQTGGTETSTTSNLIGPKPFGAPSTNILSAPSTPTLNSGNSTLPRPQSQTVTGLLSALPKPKSSPFKEVYEQSSYYETVKRTTSPPDNSVESPIDTYSNPHSSPHSPPHSNPQPNHYSNPYSYPQSDQEPDPDNNPPCHSHSMSHCNPHCNPSYNSNPNPDSDSTPEFHSNPNSNPPSNPQSAPKKNPSSVKAKSLAWPPAKPIEDITYPTASPLYIDPNPKFEGGSRQALRDKRASIEACERALARKRAEESIEREQYYRGEYTLEEGMDRVSCQAGGPVYRKVELIESSACQRSRAETSRPSSTDSARRSLTPTRIVQPIPKPWTPGPCTGGKLYEKSYAEPPKVKTISASQREVCHRERVCKRERTTEQQPYSEEQTCYRAEVCRMEQTVSKPPLPTATSCRQLQQQQQQQEQTECAMSVVEREENVEEGSAGQGLSGEHDLITEMTEEDVGNMRVKTRSTFEKTVEPKEPSDDEETQEVQEASYMKVETVERETTKTGEKVTEERTVTSSAETVSSAVDATQLCEQAKREEEEERKRQEEEDRKKQEEEERKRREEEERRRLEEEERNKKHVSFEDDSEEIVEEIIEKPLGRTVVHEERITEEDGGADGRSKRIKETYEEVVEEVLVHERIRRRDVANDQRRKSLREQVEVHQSLRDQERRPNQERGRVVCKYEQPQETMEMSKKHVQFMKQTDTGPRPIPHSALRENATPKEWKSEMVNALTTAPDRPFTPLSTSSSVKELYTEETIYLDHRGRARLQPKEQPRPISPFQRALTIAPERPYTPLSREIGPEDQNYCRSETPVCYGAKEGPCPPLDILYGEATFTSEKHTREQHSLKKICPRPLPTPPPDFRLRDTSPSPARSRSQTPSKPFNASLRKPDAIPSYQKNLVATRKGPVEGHQYQPSRTPTPTPARSKSPAGQCQMPYSPSPSPRPIRAQAPRIKDEAHQDRSLACQQSSSSHFPSRRSVTYKVEEDTDTGHISSEYAASRTAFFDEKEDAGPGSSDAVHAQFQEQRIMTTDEQSDEKTGHCHTKKSLQVVEDFERCERRRAAVEAAPASTDEDEWPPRSSGQGQGQGQCAIAKNASCTASASLTLPCPSSRPTYKSSTEVRHVRYDDASTKTCPETGLTVLPCKAHSDQGTKAGVVLVPCEGARPKCAQSGVCVMPTSDRSGVCVSPCFGMSPGSCGQPSGCCGQRVDVQVPRNCPESGICVAPCADGSVCVAPCNKQGNASRCNRGANNGTPKNLPFPQIPMPFEEFPKEPPGPPAQGKVSSASSSLTVTENSSRRNLFGPNPAARTNLSGQLARLTAKKDVPTIQLYKAQLKADENVSRESFSRTTQSHCQTWSQCRSENCCQEQTHCPPSKTQQIVDPPNFSSHPDLGSGVGGLGGAGSKSGSFAGSSAPKRGRGILNQAGGAGSRVPLCAHCNSYVRGPFITALGQIWCPDHFVCVNTQCRRPLQDIGFVEEKGQLYCEYCFERFIAPSCNKCNNKIKGDCLNAIGKHFHPECFNCAYCGKLFGNSPFFLEEGLPYCEADWNELFTTKCFACGFPVEAGDRWVEALNNNYHSQCFNCTMCKKNLEGQSFYAKGGRPFCKNHAR